MGIVGKVNSVWRYPVKSMRGEELETAFIGFAGIYGDRIFAFKSSGSPVGFPLGDWARAASDAAASPGFSPSGRGGRAPASR